MSFASQRWGLDMSFSVRFAVSSRLNHPISTGVRFETRPYMTFPPLSCNGVADSEEVNFDRPLGIVDVVAEGGPSSRGTVDDVGEEIVIRVEVDKGARN